MVVVGSPAHQGLQLSRWQTDERTGLMNEMGLVAKASFENDRQRFAPGLESQLAQAVMQASQTRETFGGDRERLFEAAFKMAGAPSPVVGQGLDALVRGIVEAIDERILRLLVRAVVLNQLTVEELFEQPESCCALHRLHQLLHQGRRFTGPECLDGRKFIVQLDKWPRREVTQLPRFEAHRDKVQCARCVQLRGLLTGTDQVGRGE